MTDRPIIMSTESVKAILDGRKTMTRRVIKPQPKTCDGHAPNWQGQILDWVGYKYSNREHWFCHTCGIGLHHIDEWSAHGIICPYGQVGDRLWVRETWAIKDCGKNVKVDEETWADGYPLERLQYIATDEPPIPDYWWNKRPSIFMPRWASRINLEITDIRVERVQEITPDDIKAEGVDVTYTGTEQWSVGMPYSDMAKLWDSLNAKRGYGWDKNNWVWVISFKEKQ